MDPERAGGPDPLERSQKIGFLSNTSPDPLKNRKVTRPEFDVMSSPGRQRNAILIGVSLAGRRWPDFSGILIISSLINLKKKKKKKRCQSWNLSEKSFLIRAGLGCKVSTKQLLSASVLDM